MEKSATFSCIACGQMNRGRTFVFPDVNLQAQEAIAIMIDGASAAKNDNDILKCPYLDAFDATGVVELDSVRAWLWELALLRERQRQINEPSPMRLIQENQMLLDRVEALERQLEEKR